MIKKSHLYCVTSKINAPYVFYKHKHVIFYFEEKTKSQSKQLCGPPVEKFCSPDHNKKKPNWSSGRLNSRSCLFLCIYICTPELHIVYLLTFLFCFVWCFNLRSESRETPKTKTRKQSNSPFWPFWKYYLFYLYDLNILHNKHFVIWRSECETNKPNTWEWLQYLEM